MVEELPVCVVGAGIAGLTAIKALTDRSIEFDCYELGSAIGGLWRYDNDSGRSPVYASLHIDTSKERFAFEDLPMPRQWPTYLHHSQVLAYLETYARAFGLVPLITFRHEVTSVVRAEDRWSVTVRDLATGVEMTKEYRAVIVANGHHWNPNVPEIDGPFTGLIMHAQEYRTPEPFIGKDVVVVGAGNTAVDLAAELSWHARSVTLSTRSGAHVLPRYLFGRPLDRWSTRMSTRLPLSVQRPLYRALLFLARGRQGSYGFPTPAAPILSQHPTVNQDILRLTKDGLVTVHRGISRTTEHEAVFVDGTTAKCDVIILATGYTISFPFLEGVIEAVDNRVDLYRRVVSVDHPDLFFVGLIQPVGAFPPLAEQQAKWVSRLLDGSPLPTVATMKAAIVRDHEKVTERYEDRPRHTIQVDYWSYLDEMKAICDEIDAAEDAARALATP